MSEFSKAHSKALEIEKELFREDATFTYPQLQMIKTVLNETICPASQKYTTKLGEVDPISGNPRLGPAMAAKVRHLADLMETLTRRNDELLSQTVQIPLSEEREMERNVTSFIPVPVVPKSLNNVFQATSETSIVTDLVRDDVDPVLSDRAAAQRALRRQQLQREQLMIDAELKRLRELPIGLDAMRNSLVEIRGNVERKEFVELCCFLKTFFENIKRHPDNEKLRCIRPDNPVIQNKVIKFPGGLELLLSLGFGINIDKEAEEEMLSKGESRNLISLLKLKMEEPSPDLDMPAWIAWFDFLEEATQLLSSLIES